MSYNFRCYACFPMSIMAFTALWWIKGQFCSGSYIWYIFAYMKVFLKHAHDAVRHQTPDEGWYYGKYFCGTDYNNKSKKNIYIFLKSQYYCYFLLKTYFLILGTYFEELLSRKKVVIFNPSGFIVPACKHLIFSYFATLYFFLSIFPSFFFFPLLFCF